MKILHSIQREDVTDAVRAKFAMVAPVLEATLLSVQRDRLERLGGVGRWSLADLAREHRDGDGAAAERPSDYVSITPAAKERT